MRQGDIGSIFSPMKETVPLYSRDRFIRGTKGISWRKGVLFFGVNHVMVEELSQSPASSIGDRFKMHCMIGLGSRGRRQIYWWKRLVLICGDGELNTVLSSIWSRRFLTLRPLYFGLLRGSSTEKTIIKLHPVPSRLRRKMLHIVSIFVYIIFHYNLRWLLRWLSFYN